MLWLIILLTLRAGSVFIVGVVLAWSASKNNSRERNTSTKPGLYDKIKRETQILIVLEDQTKSSQCFQVKCTTFPVSRWKAHTNPAVFVWKGTMWRAPRPLFNVPMHTKHISAVYQALWDQIQQVQVSSVRQEVPLTLSGVTNRVNEQKFRSFNLVNTQSLRWNDGRYGDASFFTLSAIANNNAAKDF